MCGICGVVAKSANKSVEESVVKKMTDVIAHRGPDDEGIHLSKNCGLGFRRLSIIDLAQGHQPMCNETGDIWIVFNGEIYNHKIIRQELELKGHHYKTKADTETIIHLYEEEGVDGLLKMNGMFAFAIWDSLENRLIIARDRLGIKPLHYAVTENNLIFASEIKSILEHPEVTPELNIHGLEELLTFRYISGDKTAFKGIYNLLPGHVMVCQNGTINISKFWDIAIPVQSDDLDEEEAVETLEKKLKSAVELRLMSDVPVGTFCSGGVDSSLTTAYAKLAGNAELHTFSVGFHEKEWDETPYAAKVAERYATNHHVLRIDGKAYADSLPKLIWYHDIPIYHPSTILIYHVSKLAREFVTVVLTGEGADEAFGGYPRYLIPREYNRFKKLPLVARKGLGKVINFLPHRKLNKIGSVLSLTPEEVILYNGAYVSPQLVRSLIGSDSESDLDYRRSIVSGMDLEKGNLVEATMLSDMKNYIPSLLHRLDKMTMATSLEGRVPFLDHNLVEWAYRVPLNLKIRGLKNKYIVKKLGEKMLPHQVIYRQKVGFGVPVVDWLRDPAGLGRYLRLFSEDQFKDRGIVDSTMVHNLVQEHLSGKVNHCEVLWSLINLELWLRIFIDKTLDPLEAAQ